MFKLPENIQKILDEPYAPPEVYTIEYDNGNNRTGVFCKTNQVFHKEYWERGRKERLPRKALERLETLAYELNISADGGPIHHGRP